MSAFLEQVLTAHGGLAQWQSYRTVIARLSFGGFAFAMRFNRAGLLERTVRIQTQIPQVTFEAYPQPGKLGVFTPELVWIESDLGKKIAERPAPRAAFRSFRRQLWWDDLDLLYFAGYACWNYFTSPFLLAMDGVQIKELSSWQENNETWHRLEVLFPEAFPTHCRKQIFYFDQDFMMQRLDYNPEVFASWAKAAHYCFDYQTFGGIKFPGKRKVVPRNKDHTSQSFPILVWIDIKQIDFE